MQNSSSAPLLWPVKQESDPARHAAKRKVRTAKARDEALAAVVETLPLWQLDIVELTGHNLETRGREEVNRLLDEGWRLLHIYTLKYHEDGVWRERPMAILGRSRQSVAKHRNNEETFRAECVQGDGIVGDS